MAENLEVFFCDLCNTSVPQPDLDAGVAARVKGKVVGACCLAELRGSRGDPRGRALGPASTVVLLAGLAGVAIFLDWRLSEEALALRRRTDTVESASREQQARLVGIEERLGGAASEQRLAGVADRLTDLANGMGEAESRLREAIGQAIGGIATLAKGVDALVAVQNAGAARLGQVEQELRRFGQELAEGLAKPRPTESAAPVAPAEAPMPSLPAPVASGLPAELAHAVAGLEDPDPGTRFEAVDKLVQSRSPAVLPSLLGAARDADPFVRRLTVEGLGEFRKPESVDALLVALGDPESIVRHAAYAALRKLTGQAIVFDPDAGKEDRRAAQRRWQDWWEKARSGF